MPISLRELKAKTAQVDVFKETKVPGFKAGDLLVSYKLIPSMLLGDAEKFQRLAQEDPEAAVDTFVQIIRDTVSEWDLLDDDDKPVPLTDEGIRSIPAELLTHIVTAIQLHRSPNQGGGRQSPKR